MKLRELLEQLADELDVSIELTATASMADFVLNHEIWLVPVEPTPDPQAVVLDGVIYLTNKKAGGPTAPHEEATPMLSDEIKPGDVLLDPQDGSVIYTVIDVDAGLEEVRALVRYETDGGSAERVWDIGKEVPLVRP